MQNKNITKKNVPEWVWTLAPYIFYVGASLLLWHFIPSLSARLENDSHAYLNFVDTFETFGSFDRPGVTIRTTWFGLGYPIFMVACRWIYQSPYSVIIAQILLGLLTLFALQKTTDLLCGTQAATYAAWIAATNLGLILYPHFFLTESLMVALLSVSLLLLVQFMQEQEWWRLADAAFLLGFSMVIKPSVLYLIPLCACSIAFYAYKNWRMRCLVACTFVYFFTVIPTLYMIRNYKAYGAWYLKSVDKVNLYYFYLPHLAAAQDGTSFDDEQKRVLEAYPVTNYVDATCWQKPHQELKKRVIATPSTAVIVWVTQMFKTFAGLYTNHLKVLIYDAVKGGDCSFFKLSGSWLQRAWGYLAFGGAGNSMIMLGLTEIILRILLLFFVCWTITMIFVRRTWNLFWLLVIPLGYFWGITGADGCARLRMLMEPYFIILAAQGIASVRYYITRS
jgi:hypothetical protein